MPLVNHHAAVHHARCMHLPLWHPHSRSQRRHLHAHCSHIRNFSKLIGLQRNIQSPCYHCPGPHTSLTPHPPPQRLAHATGRSKALILCCARSPPTEHSRGPKKSGAISRQQAADAQRESSPHSTKQPSIGSAPEEGQRLRQVHRPSESSSNSSSNSRSSRSNGSISRSISRNNSRNTGNSSRSDHSIAAAVAGRRTPPSAAPASIDSTLQAVANTLQQHGSDLSAIDAVQALHSLAKLAKQTNAGAHKQRINQLASQIQDLLQQPLPDQPSPRLLDSDSRALSICMYSLGQLHRSSCTVQWPLVQQLLHLAVSGELLLECKSQGLSNFVTACAYLRFTAAEVQGLMPVVVKAVRQRKCMQDAVPQAWSTLIWGLATMGFQHTATEPLVPELLTMVESGMEQAKPQAWSNLLWGLATMGFKQQAARCLLSRMLEMPYRGMRGASPQEWANLLWALATMGMDAASVRPLMAELCAAVRAASWTRGAKPQAWANMLWALASLGFRAGDVRPVVGELLRGVEEADCMQGAKGQSWSNLLWALATMGFQAAEVQPLVARLTSLPCQASLQQAQAQQWSNLLWALATLGCNATAVQPLLPLLVQAVVQRRCMRQAQPQAWSNLWWALTAMEVDVHSIAGVMPVLEQSASVDRCMASATPQAWANTLWGLAKLGLCSAPLFEQGCKAVATASHRAHHTTGQDAANVLYACSQVGYCSAATQRLVDSLHSSSHQWLPTANSQDIANSAHALATLDLTHHPLLDLLLQRAHALCPADLGAFGLRQLFQAHIELSDLGQANRGLHGPLQQAASQAWLDHLQESSTVSSSQQQVAAVAKALGYSEVQLEAYTADGWFRVDVAVEVHPGCQVAIEFDGPSHFLHRPEGSYNGPALLRHRQLRLAAKRGFQGLVLVPYNQWYRLGKPQQKKHYLSSKVRQALASLGQEGGYGTGGR